MGAHTLREALPPLGRTDPASLAVEISDWNPKCGTDTVLILYRITESKVLQQNPKYKYSTQGI